MRKLLLIVALLGIAGGAVWFGFFRGERETQEQTNFHLVKREVLKITLTERGTLKVKKSIQIKAETQGKISWLIDEGKKVKKGDVLVKMDTEQTKQQIDQFANQITQLKAELKSAETELTVQEGQNETNIEKADLNQAVAKVELEKLLLADIPEKERDLELSIAEAKTSLKRAEEKYAAYRKLQRQEFVTKTEVDDAEIQLRKAKNSLETAELKSDSYQKYQRPLDIRKKKAAVKEADRGLDRAKKQADAQLNSRKARVTQKRVNLTRIERRHKKEQEKLGKMILKAPTDGTILIGDPDNPWNNRNIKVGAQVWNSMVLLTLPDVSELGVTVQIHEADIGKVKKGMQAFVKSEMAKDRIFQAEISKIDTVANAGQRGWGNNVKRFKVELSLTGDIPDLKTGTSAEVEILVDELPNVLTVPAQCIHAKEDKYYCYVLRGGTAHRVRVLPGMSNDAYAEIRKGLKEGDKVLLSMPDTFEAEEDPKGFDDEEKNKKAKEAKEKSAEKKSKKTGKPGVVGAKPVVKQEPSEGAAVSKLPAPGKTPEKEDPSKKELPPKKKTVNAEAEGGTKKASGS